MFVQLINLIFCKLSEFEPNFSHFQAGIRVFLALLPHQWLEHLLYYQFFCWMSVVMVISYYLRLSNPPHNASAVATTQVIKLYQALEATYDNVIKSKVFSSLPFKKESAAWLARGCCCCYYHQCSSRYVNCSLCLCWEEVANICNQLFICYGKKKRKRLVE